MDYYIPVGSNAISNSKLLAEVKREIAKFFDNRAASLQGVNLPPVPTQSLPSGVWYQLYPRYGGNSQLFGVFRKRNIVNWFQNYDDIGLIFFGKLMFLHQFS